MSQPRDFGFTEEAALLKEAARRFFQDNLPSLDLHKSVADDYDPFRDPDVKWRPDLWQKIVELGWLSLVMPSEADMPQLPTIALTLLLEEAGRAAAPVPLLTSFQTASLLALCKGEAAQKALADMSEGAIIAHALASDTHEWDSDQAGVSAEETDEGFTLTGSAHYVCDAGKAEKFLVKAQGREGIGLYLVDANAAGLTITADHILDLTRDQAHLNFDQVKIEKQSEVAKRGDAFSLLCEARPKMITCLAADMVGAGEWQLQTTVDYAMTRVQFDRPIAFFQAVKHPLVDLMVMIDQARALVCNAACALDHEADKAALYAHMAMAAACDVASYGSKKSIQLHGGIGFTWECFVHIYAKRQKHSQMMVGDAIHHRKKMAELMLGPLAA